MIGPCAKVRVTCEIITPDGRTFRGENSCRRPQATCPREPGEGYGPCRDICRQEGHAEDQALKAAREWAAGATAYVTFHRAEPGHICGECVTAMAQAGVKAVRLVEYAEPRAYPVGHPTYPVRAMGAA